MSKGNMLKNRLLCGAMLTVTAAFVFFYGGIVPYAMLYTSLAIVTASLLYLAVIALYCDVVCTLDRFDVVKGGEIVLTIEIKNNSPLFMPYVIISHKKIDGFIYDANNETISVAGFTGKRAHIVLTSKYRGRYDANIPQIRLMDFLGIANVRIKYARLPDVLVYPKVCEFSEFTAVGKFDMDNQMNPDNISEDVTAVSDVREYMDGDGIRKIHWNLSARMLSFMSKNYENITKSRLTLLINLSGSNKNHEHEQKLMIEDKTIEAAVSVVFHFLSRLWNVTLCYYEKEYYTYSLSDTSMFGMAYDHLAFIEFSSAYDIARIVENISVETAGERLNLCVITQEITDGLLDKIIRYSELGSRIALLYVCESKADLGGADWVKAISKSAVTLYAFDYDSVLSDALSSPHI